MTQLTLTSSENTLIESMDDNFADMLTTVEAWSSQNSGSHNRDGLIAMRALLMDAARALPGTASELALAPGEYVSAAGIKEAVHYEPAVHICVWDAY